MRRSLKPPFLVTYSAYSAIALSTACSSTTSGGDVDASASDAGSTSDASACPAVGSACDVDAGDLACTTAGGYPNVLSCLGGVYCATYLNPPSPVADAGECPATPPTNGSACHTEVARLYCHYACDGGDALVVCDLIGGGSWCGVAAPDCTFLRQGP